MAEISVIVPVYNVQNYLKKCVDSIIGQSFSDYDLILVDDGSTDSSGQICDELAADNGRITVIHKTNGGLSSARNTGIDWALKNSDSSWICFVDSDDWIHPSFLEYLYRAAVENKANVSVCQFQTTSDREQPFENYEYECDIWTGEDAYTLKSGIPAAYAWNKFYRKESFREIRFPEGKYWEDLFITFQFVLSEQTVPMVNLPLYYYYQNDQGIVRSKWTDKNLDYYEANSVYIDYVRENCNKDFYKKELEGYSFVLYTGYQKVKENGAVRADGTAHAKILQQFTRKALHRYYFDLTRSQKLEMLSVLYPGLVKMIKQFKSAVLRK